MTYNLYDIDKSLNGSWAMIPTNLWMHSTFDLIVFSISIISFVKHRTWIFSAWIVSFWFEIIVVFLLDHHFKLNRNFCRVEKNRIRIERKIDFKLENRIDNCIQSWSVPNLSFLDRFAASSALLQFWLLG